MNFQDLPSIKMNLGNNEEAFVLSTLKEFVKIWGSGSQAKLNFECRNGNAWVQLDFQLGHHCYHQYESNPDISEDLKKVSVSTTFLSKFTVLKSQCLDNPKIS